MRALSLLWIIFCLAITNLSGQLDTLQLKLQPMVIPGAFTHMAVDPLGQIILANAAGDIIKYDKTAQLQFRYSNARLGDLGHIDASDPFSLLFYYPDFQTILLLDRTLGERARLDLRLLDLAYVTAVARSTADQLWVYDDWAYQLKQIDATGKTNLSTLDLRQQIGVTTAADLILVDKDRVYVHFPDYGLAVFNNFGQFIERIELQQGERLLQAQEGRLLLTDGERFVRMDVSGQTRRPWYVAANSGHLPQQLNTRGSRVFVLYPHAIVAATISRLAP